MIRVRTREAYEKEEAERLAPYAVCSGGSAGRVVAEPDHPYRTAFQRDRDRIIHARAFRRLEYKTQVFIFHEGDHYRNRLTHTLEGAQIARTLARALRLNEDLAEAVVLAHDLGHTPFGHAGERALAKLLADDGGFDHNRQSLRVVDLLEERYPGFLGLNLTDETREGILKHGQRFSHPIALPPETPHPSLEARVADLADEIAYTNHDLDDGLRSGLLRPEDLDEVALWCEARETVRARGEMPERVARSQTIVALLNRLVTDLIEETARRLDAASIDALDEVRASREPLVALPEECASKARDLKRFLLQRLYRHPRVLAMNLKAERLLGDLYGAYRENPELLPPRVRERFPEEGEARAVADYVAGMTDRLALDEHRVLLDPHDRR